MKIEDIDNIIQTLTKIDISKRSLRLAAAKLCDQVADEIDRQLAHKAPVDNIVPTATK